MAIDTSQAIAPIDAARLLEMYERMVQIRTFEDLAGKNFADGLVPGFVHLYAGEEAVAVGVCTHLTDRDYITSTHRGHGHCIAKGVDIDGMVAELMGKATGTCKGKGGSMHIADVDKGMLGANGIVGAGLPLAAGAALTAKTLGTGGVAVSLLRRRRLQPGHVPRGAEPGRDLEAAGRLRLREQRLRRVDPVHYHCSTTDIANRAAAYEMPGVVVDGLDLFAVYEAAGEAIARARRGEGPVADRGQDLPLLRPLPGRHGHLPHRRGARTGIKERDAIQSVRNYAIQHGMATADELDAIDARTREHLDQAWKDAKAAPWPEESELLTDVYVSY